MARRLPAAVRAVKGSKSVAFQTRWYDAAGKRHAATFDTAAEAGAHYQEMMRNRRRGLNADPIPGRTPFADWLEMWWQMRDVRASTRSVDHSIIKLHIAPHWGTWRLVDIKRPAVQEWLRELTRGGASARGPAMRPLRPGTANKALALMRSCLDAAVDEGFLVESPAARVKQVPSDTHERRFLQQWELVELESAIHQWWQPMIAFAVDSALRIGELAALRVGDVDLAAREVRVRGSAAEIAKRFTGAESQRQITDTKTARGRRVVPTLTDTTVARIAAMILERGLATDDFLFTGTQGGVLSPRAWRARVWHPAVAKACLAGPLPTPHSLRHTGISLWIATGEVGPMQIAMWAGHGSVNTTYQIYGHLIKTDTSTTNARLEEMRNESLAIRHGNVVPLRTA